MKTARWLRIGILLLVALLAGCAGRMEPTVSPPAPQSPLSPVSPLPTPSEEVVPSPMPRATLTPPAERPTPSPPPAIDAAALLRERCTACHTLDRVEGSRKTAEEWDQTVSRMVRRGARLTEEEKRALIAYLAAQYGK
ncbi:MAG: hypothetical protein RMK65_02220 [Anaerolineae bacterium]|nr:hypothetical protein [Anaerolineae bacterium]MCX8068277.1 hypothetical protein [Anaerolineae bacterium]MDW7990958.1 hypothetical protein [Anaerolineae bacterium]